MDDIFRYEEAERRCGGLTQSFVVLDHVVENTLIAIHSVQMMGVITDPEHLNDINKLIWNFRRDMQPYMKRLEHTVPPPECRCKKPYRISVNEPDGWLHGTMCGVRFDDEVDEDTTRFQLRRRNNQGSWELLTSVDLRDNGEWWCNSFKTLDGMYFPEVIHPNFKNLLKCLFEFYRPIDGQKITAEELLMCRDEPNRE